MKTLLRRYCILIALLAFWLPQATAQNLPKVQKIEIRHVGPPAASDALIRANIRVKEGDSYTRSTVDDDVRNLYGTGYFYNIRVAEEPVAGGMNLVYIVQGKLRITDVRFEGNKQLSASKLRKDVASKIGDPLDERKLFTDTRAILKHYQKSGYQKTEVKYSVEPNDTAGTGKVTYEITEAPKVKIQDIIFEGATAFSHKKLSRVLKTKRHWMFSWLTRSDVLKDEQFEDDKERLIEFYRNEGYIDFEIKDVKVEQVSPKYIVLRIQLNEGQQYKVGSVALKGNKLFPSEEITKGLKMGPGALFTPKGLNKDEEHIRDHYGARGYIDSRVSPVRTANTTTGNIDLTYQVDEKDQVFIEKVEIKGNVKTKDKVIRRELAVSPGEAFDMVRVKRSKERLEGTQFFGKVEAQPEDTDVPNRKNLVVAVEERNTGNLQLGAGFSTVDNIVGFVEVSQGNFDLMKPPTFTGGGQKFRLRASIGTVSQDYILSFVEPWFLDRKLAFGTDIYHRKQSYQSALYDEEQTGMSLSLTRALGSDFLIGKISYTIENIGITGIDFSTNSLASKELQSEAGHTLVSKIGASLAYDTRGGGMLPNKGQRTELLTELAGGPLGAEADYYKFELRSSWYFKGFWEGHVIEAGARGGIIESYSGSTRVPFFNRYFLGGPNSLRGFRYAQVGPRDSLGEPSGGETYWLGTVEYSLPIIDRLRFAVFYDAGNAYSDSFSFNPNRAAGEVMINDNVGLGIRLNIPNLGPLRLDYGIPLHADRFNGGGGKFNFSVGFTRDY